MAFQPDAFQADTFQLNPLNVYAQAQADILAITTTFAQAQSDILVTTNQFAQGQSFVIYKQSVYAQAQAYFLGNGYAQAQADILVTTNVFAQSQSDIVVSTSIFAQAQVYILPVGFAQAQADILATTSKYGSSKVSINATTFTTGYARVKVIYTGISFAQALAQLREQPVGLATALIDSSIKVQWAMAQASICWTDDFTRVVNPGLGGQWTWVDYDSNFGPDGSTSTYQVDGNQIIDSPDNWDVDSYQLNQSVPLNGTVSFEFTTSSFFDPSAQPWIGIDFGPGYQYGNQINLYVWRAYTDNTFTTLAWYIGDWYGFVIPRFEVAVTTNTTYVVKAAYDEFGHIAYKLWDKSGTEPDWMVWGDLSSLPPNFNGEFVAYPSAFIEFEFDQAVSSIDNVNFCSPEQFPHLTTVVGQASVQITNLTPTGNATVDILQTYYPTAYAQAALNAGWGYATVQAFIIPTYKFAQAQTVIALTLPFNDSYNRTTERGVSGNPYIWPAIGNFGSQTIIQKVHLDGQEIIIPEVGAGNNYINNDDFYALPIKPFPATGTLQFDVFFASGGTQVTYMPLVNFRAYRTNGAIDLGVRWSSVYSGFYVGAVGVGGSYETLNFSITFDTWYTIKADWEQTGSLRWKIWARDTSNEGSPIVQGSYAWTTLGTSIYIPTLTFIGQQVGETRFTNLRIGNSYPTGMARVKIDRPIRFAQARVRIKRTNQQLAQAQAIINQVMRVGQAQAFIGTTLTEGYAQAQVWVSLRFKKVAQAQAWIRLSRWVWAQALTYIKPRYGVGQAQTYITNSYAIKWAQANADIKTQQLVYAQALSIISFSIALAQAQALIYVTIQTGQARANISSSAKTKSANAKVAICYTYQGYSQATTRIYPGHYVLVVAQAGASIVGYFNANGQAQAFIKRTIEFGQAQGYVSQPLAGKLVRYNGYQIPGYLQREVLPDTETLYLSNNASSNFEEYQGLSNKNITIELRILDESYQKAKEQLQLASSILHSKRSGYAKLTIINPDRYYLGRTKSVNAEQTAGALEKALSYQVEFDCLPWAFGNHHTISTDTDEVSRTYSNGTWTPTTVTVTGRDITVSGYTPDGQFTGFISVGGEVNNLRIETGIDSVLGDIINPDYELYVAPGRTLFVVSGATEWAIEYQDRWSM